MQLQVDCTTDISSAFAGVTSCRRDFSGVVYVVKSSAFGERLKDSHALGLYRGSWVYGVYVCWGVHTLASNLEAGCTSKCMHFPQIPRLACLLVLVLVTIEVEHRFGYLCC